MLPLTVPLSQTAFFDLELGTVNGFGSGVTSASVENYADGWMRLSMTGTTVATGGNNLNDIGLSRTGSTLNFVDGQGAYIWGAQVEAGATASSYIPTAGSTVSRAADQITIATSKFRWLNTAGTIYGEVYHLSANTVGGFFAIGVFPNALYSDGKIRALRVESGGSTTADLSPSSNLNAFNKQACAWAANDFAAVMNGGTVSTDASGATPVGTFTTARIGFGSLNEYNNRHIKYLVHRPRRTANADLQALTS
jgi:hypothetical protein